MPDALSRLRAALADRYRLERELGQGGMATVYLAQDLKHDRQVAIKVLKPELAAVLGADRFVQEIKTTAALSHPHILPLFDSGEADGFLYYVMPFIAGETVRDKLNREKQFGIEESVRIATEVADALDYAHRHGVIHRDIKPENILLHDGRPMVMDFGIALAVSAAAGGRMTETGLSLGTPHYMSPEQATAEKDITGRSDIYSVASVLYEMLTGQPPHLGGSAQQVIMKIIAEPVAVVTTHRRNVPPNVAAALAQALEKLPADRFETARAFADALANRGFRTAAVSAAGPLAARPSYRPVALLVALGLVTALALWGWLRPGSPAAMTAQQIVLGSESTRPGVVLNAAIAPDGSAIVYMDTGSADNGGGQLRLMIQERDRPFPTVLATLQDSKPGPSFSPDGQWIAFTNGKVYRVARGGGLPVALSDSSGLGTTTWLDNGTIVWGDPGGQGFLAAPSAGGTTRRVLAADSAGTTYDQVSAIPGENAVIVTTSGRQGRVLVLDLGTGRTTDLQTRAMTAWVVGRRLLFLRGNGGLYAVGFDRRRRTVAGSPVTVLDSIQVTTDPNSGAGVSLTGDIAIGADGTVLYVRRSPLVTESAVRLVRVALDGTAAPVPVKSLGGTFVSGLDVSPDGRRAAVAVTDSTEGRSDIYIVDLASGTPSRLTFAGTRNIRPRWSPDGRRVMYVSDAGGAGIQLWARSADGAGAPALLVGTRGVWGGEWSPDGRWVLYRTDPHGGASRDILAVRTDGDTTPVPLAVTPAQEVSPAVSPDGRWLAYSSNANGTEEVFVQPFPKAAGAIWQVSSGSGFAPRWSHDGRRIFYQDSRNRLLVVDVRTVPTFQVVREQVLFQGPFLSYDYYPTYAVLPDDRHLLMFQFSAGALGKGAHVILMKNWMPTLLQGGAR